MGLGAVRETACSEAVVSGTHTCVGRRSTAGEETSEPRTTVTASTTATVEGSAR